jgi:hypothetical protein
VAGVSEHVYGGGMSSASVYAINQHFAALQVGCFQYFDASRQLSQICLIIYL